MTATATGSRSDDDVLSVPVAGGELTVGRWGSLDEGAPLVVAAHGITATHVSWALVGERLAAAGACLLAPDLRGRGGSAGLPPPHGMAAHAADLMAVLDHAGRASAIVVGHSMGGFVAATAAVQHRGRVDRLVLVDGGPALIEEMPEGQSIDDVLGAIIGPALGRLETTFASLEEHRAFWAEHPAVGGVPAPVRDAYADYDLEQVEGGWRSRSNAAAIREDARDTFDNPDVAAAVTRLERSTPFLYAERGMLDGPDGLYPEARIADVRAKAPALVPERVADVNHYTIVMSPHGADAIVAAVLSEDA